jgi:hypothetical protein
MLSFTLIKLLLSIEFNILIVNYILIMIRQLVLVSRKIKDSVFLNQNL